MGRERNDRFMKRPVLVIMAAGMGSRYGGLKQIDPIDREGHIIIDFSIYDARRAGFEKVVFIIKKDNEEEFKEETSTYSKYVGLVEDPVGVKNIFLGLSVVD